MYLPRELFSHLYTQLVRCHQPQSPPVLIISSLEPDAICACRILTSLLKRDYIPHKIQPVSGYADLAQAGQDLVKPLRYEEGNGKTVICLGVGALVDLSNLLGLEDDENQDDLNGLEVWVLDARRPWNLSNVFSEASVTVPLQEVDGNARRKPSGVTRGCIERSYRPGKGGIIVFDDGDIHAELGAERDAYYALAEMPEFDENENDDNTEDEQEDTDSRKRKSWSDRDDEHENSDEENERPRQRRRSNSGSSIASSDQNRTPPSSQPSSSPSKPVSPKQPTAKQLRKKLLNMRRSHETVLEQYYTLGTSYSEPISALAYSLASDLGRDDNDLLWLAIVGTTSLEVSGQTSTGLGTLSQATAQTPAYLSKSWKANRQSRLYALLRDEVRRLNPPPANQSPSISPAFGASSSPSDKAIRLSPDPRFLLLRHWSLYDSMYHSPYLASRLHIWNDAGVKRLHKLLAKMGISLSQCKQTYTHMDIDLKKSLREQLLKYAGVYGLDEVVPSGSGHASYDQEGWSFIRSWGWKAQLNATDVAVVLGAILDFGSSHISAASRPPQFGSSQATTTSEADLPSRSEHLIPRFFAAYDALAPNHPTQLLSSIPQAQALMRSIHRTGSALLSKHQLRHLRAFRMGVVKDGPDLNLFANNPGALVKLALWVGEAVAVSEKDKKGVDEATPLVLAALDEHRGTYVIVGTGGGIGSGADMEARKEKEEKKTKKQAEKAVKQKIRDDKKAAKAAARAAREEEGLDDDGDDDESEEESDDSESDDDEADEETKQRMSKRGYGNNRFGIAFQEVVEETNARVKIDSFDHCVVEVRKEDLAGFLEGLSLKSVVGR